MKLVYNGYEEHFFNGKELKNFFDKCFLMTKYKKTCVLNMTIIEYLEFIKVDDAEIYRIFENGHCCRLANGKTDKEIAFFEYIPKNCFIQYNNYESNDKKCKKCGASMKIFISKYGEFLGCTNYPKCQYKKTLYIIGKEKHILISNT